MQRFLAQVQEVRLGALQDLEEVLREVQAWHLRALNATTAAAEREAIEQVEHCATRAEGAARQCCASLQDLARQMEADAAGPLAGGTEDRLRRQSFAGIKTLFKQALNAYYQAQQRFKAEMEAKVRRQLKAAFPEADDAAVAAVQAAGGGRSSAASAIQDTLRLQPGDSSNLNISLAIQATRDKCNELEKLARAAQDLLQQFQNLEAQVILQGEVIDDIALHMEATRVRTEAARHQLELAVTSRNKCRWRWCALGTFLLVVLVVVVVLWWTGHLGKG